MKIIGTLAIAATLNLLFSGMSLSAPAKAQSSRTTALPDGHVTQWRGYSAWLVDPTKRYDHGALGDEIEAGGFAIKFPGGRTRYFYLDRSAVFEDLRVRLADMDGDGIPEAIVIKSYLKRGAAVVMYKLVNGRIAPMVEGPAIGRSHRWLNIAGIADFNGDGRPDIAYVQTPHLAGIVRVFSLRSGKLHEIGRLTGYTNHRIGSRDLDLAQVERSGAKCCAKLVLPVIGSRAKAVLGFRNGVFVELNRR